MTHTGEKTHHPAHEARGLQMLDVNVCSVINSASLPAPLDRHSAVWWEAVQLRGSVHRPVAMVHFLRLWLSTMGTGMM